ncbi:MAG: acylphosphatase [Anaerolineae bacterium]|jgi:acylphosphatase|nr:acylphosphatase [Anaerolineae bacterium]
MGLTQPSSAASDAASAVPDHKAVHVTVSGYVQGVGFRYFTRASAQRSGVVGWVRNTDDGDVEIWAEGAEKRIQQFIEAIRRGPSQSEVRDVVLSWQPPLGHFRSFHIRD